MKLTHAAKALVTLKPDARTLVDFRIRRLNTQPMLRKVAAHYGYRVEHADANGLLYIPKLKCAEKSCGADWNDLEAHPAMRYDGRSASYPDGSPEHIYCTVCSGSRETAATLFERLCTKQRAKTLDTWAITRLPEIDYTVVRFNEKFAIGESFQPLARQVAPKRLDLDLEAVLIRVPDQRTASEAWRQDDFPSEAIVVVPVTHELIPKRRWHSERMSETDQAPIRRYQRQRIREAEAAVATEVEQFRQEAMARQRA